MKMGVHMKKYNDYNFSDSGGFNIVKNNLHLIYGEKSDFEKHHLKKAGMCFVWFAVYLVALGLMAPLINGIG